MSAKERFILKGEIAGAELPYFLKLNREESKLEVFKKCGSEKLYDNGLIRKAFNADAYVIFEKALSFPCIFGGETTPTPRGLFHIEAKSAEEYISSYYPSRSHVKFFGYLVIFEDYFIHSDLYEAEETAPDPERAISRQDKTTAGCIRLTQDDLFWLMGHIDTGTLVIL